MQVSKDADAFGDASEYRAQSSVDVGDALVIVRRRDAVLREEDRLAATDPEKARIVELRFFGGLEMEEIAEVLGVSEDAARWKWRLARAWLLRELSTGARHGG